MTAASRAKQAHRLSRAFDRALLPAHRIIAAADITDTPALAAALDDTGPVFGQLPGADPEPLVGGPAGRPVVVVPGDAPAHRVNVLARSWPASWVDDLAPVVVLERDVTLDAMVFCRCPAGVDAPGVPVTLVLDGLARDIGTGDWRVSHHGTWAPVDGGIARAVAEVSVLRRLGVMTARGVESDRGAHPAPDDPASAQWWAGVLRCPVALVRSALERTVAR